jgi:sialidase-1
MTIENTDPTHSSARRQFLKTGGLLCAGVMAAPAQSFGQSSAGTVLETKIISKQPQYYNGWPTVMRRKNGELWLTWSGGRVSHVCPFGQVQAMTSRDEGKTWTWPRVLLDSAIDDRDSGVIETAKGTLIATTFTSLAYESLFEKKAGFSSLKKGGWETEEMKEQEYERWKACHERLNAEERKADLGVWVIRSEDGGMSWSGRIDSTVNSPHGPIQLADGRLLYAGKQLWTDEKKIGVCESKDDGLTWQWVSEIPARKGDAATSEYHELHAVEAADGTILVQVRNHSATDKGWTLQTESADGGKTWSELHPVCYGLPSHLLRLRDNRLVMTYGHRRAPFGNQARVSSDHGKTWSDEIILSGDGIGGDLGYPSTVELTDGSLLTVWYESMAEQPLAVLRQAHWTLT